MKLSIALALALLASCGSKAPTPTSSPAVATEAKKPAPAGEDWALDPTRESMFLMSPAGTRIEVAPIVSPSNPDLTRRFLFRARGTDSEYDGAVVITERKRNNNHQFFIARIGGEPAWLLQYFPQTDSWEFAGLKRNARRGEKVATTEESVDGGALLALRKQQRGSHLASIETLDRASSQAWQEREFQEIVDTLPGACQKAKVRIDWNTVPDEAFSQYSVVRECVPPVLSLRDFCNGNPLFQDRVGQEIRIACVIDGDPTSSDAQWKVADGANGEILYTAGKGRDHWAGLINAWRQRLDASVTVYKAGDLHVLMNLELGRSTVHYGRDGVFAPGASIETSHPSEFILPSGGVRNRVERRDDSWFLVCGRKRTLLEPLPSAERDSIVGSWKVEKEPRWKRESYFLARDTRGNYYYVDRFREDFGGKRYRVFVGRRGQAKLTKLKGLVEDSEGTVFSTESGDLRLVVDSGTKKAVWIKGRKELALTPVSVTKNRQLIFDELGVYYGDELGFACE